MKIKSTHKYLLTGSTVVILLMAFSLVNQPDAQNSANATFRLQAPLFASVARAESDSITSFIEDEAGISAYFQASSSITLDDVRDVFRTIEVETADYIIGSVPVTNYSESEDVHVYVHTDGWMVGYYLVANPVGKIFDWKAYESSGGATITTKLENVLTIVAAQAGISFSDATYYDFRYPNATHLMLVVEELIDSSGSTVTDPFQINLPSSFQYYERSWSLGSHVQNCHNNNEHSTYYLDDAQIAYHRHCCDTYATDDGVFEVSQLLPDTNHEVTVEVNCGVAWGGLALLYRIP